MRSFSTDEVAMVRPNQQFSLRQLLAYVTALCCLLAACVSVWGCLVESRKNEIREAVRGGEVDPDAVRDILGNKEADALKAERSGE